MARKRTQKSKTSKPSKSRKIAVTSNYGQELMVAKQTPDVRIKEENDGDRRICQSNGELVSIPIDAIYALNSSSMRHFNPGHIKEETSDSITIACTNESAESKLDEIVQNVSEEDVTEPSNGQELSMAKPSPGVTIKAENAGYRRTCQSNGELVSIPIDAIYALNSSSMHHFKSGHIKEDTSDCIIIACSSNSADSQLDETVQNVIQEDMPEPSNGKELAVAIPAPGVTIKAENVGNRRTCRSNGELVSIPIDVIYALNNSSIRHFNQSHIKEETSDSITTACTNDSADSELDETVQNINQEDLTEPSILISTKRKSVEPLSANMHTVKNSLNTSVKDDEKVKSSQCNKETMITTVPIDIIFPMNSRTVTHIEGLGMTLKEEPIETASRRCKEMELSIQNSDNSNFEHNCLGAGSQINVNVEDIVSNQQHKIKPSSIHTSNASSLTVDSDTLLSKMEVRSPQTLSPTDAIVNEESTEPRRICTSSIINHVSLSTGSPRKPMERKTSSPRREGVVDPTFTVTPSYENIGSCGKTTKMGQPTELELSSTSIGSKENRRSRSPLDTYVPKRPKVATNAKLHTDQENVSEILSTNSIEERQRYSRYEPSLSRSYHNDSHQSSESTVNEIVLNPYATNLKKMVLNPYATEFVNSAVIKWPEVQFCVSSEASPSHHESNLTQDSDSDYGWEDPLSKPIEEVSTFEDIDPFVKEKLLQFDSHLKTEYDLDKMQAIKDELFRSIDDSIMKQTNKKLKNLDILIQKETEFVPVDAQLFGKMSTKNPLQRNELVLDDYIKNIETEYERPELHWNLEDLIKKKKKIIDDLVIKFLLPYYNQGRVQPNIFYTVAQKISYVFYDRFDRDETSINTIETYIDTMLWDFGTLTETFLDVHLIP